MNESLSALVSWARLGIRCPWAGCLVPEAIWEMMGVRGWEKYYKTSSHWVEPVSSSVSRSKTDAEWTHVSHIN